MKIVCIGDFHIPHRAENIPDWIVNIIKNEKPDLILCTGDLESRETLDFLKTLGETKVVRGNMDYLDLPLHETIQCGKTTIGLIHGSGIHPRGDPKQLFNYAEKMNAKILVSGHTHKQEVTMFNNILLVNPGSACGTWGGGPADEKESFIILELNNEIKTRKFVNGEELK